MSLNSSRGFLWLSFKEKASSDKDLYSCGAQCRWIWPCTEQPQHGAVGAGIPEFLPGSDSAQAAVYKLEFFTRAMVELEQRSWKRCDGIRGDTGRGSTCPVLHDIFCSITPRWLSAVSSVYTRLYGSFLVPAV